MIKVFSMWKRNPALTAEECESHYLDKHTKLAIQALSNAPGFIRYVQNKVIAQTNIDFNDTETARQVDPDYDRIVELYFEDRESFENAMATPEMAACLADHPNFMNIERAKSLVTLDVSETVVLDKGAGKT